MLDLLFFVIIPQFSFFSFFFLSLAQSVFQSTEKNLPSMRYGVAWLWPGMISSRLMVPLIKFKYQYFDFGQALWIEYWTINSQHDLIGMPNIELKIWTIGCKTLIFSTL